MKPKLSPMDDASNTQAASQVDCPALSSLGLDADDLMALARQGFLSFERRGGGVYCRLRFRREGRQIVRYVGCDVARIGRVREELDRLQKNHRQGRQLAMVAQHVRRAFRAHKAQVASLLEQAGCRFHGHAVRRRSRPRASEVI